MRSLTDSSPCELLDSARSCTESRSLRHRPGHNHAVGSAVPSFARSRNQIHDPNEVTRTSPWACECQNAKAYQMMRKSESCDDLRSGLYRRFRVASSDGCSVHADPSFPSERRWCDVNLHVVTPLRRERVRSLCISQQHCRMQRHTA